MSVTVADPVVRFIGVKKTYDGSALVVRNLHLDVRRGEFLTLLGPSGSGKTTTLMLLAGFETPTAGEILLEGREISRLPAHKREIGVVFQNYALFPHMTVAENIAFSLSVRKHPAADIAAEVRRALDMIDMAGFGARKPAQLSGGQQQRVALARALVFKPKIVLLDEPLGALDKQLREQMQFELRRIHSRLGVTMIYVTHDQSEALAMSDRIAVFNDGVIQQISDPETLYLKPTNLFVSRFIGDSNTLSGVVESIDRTVCTVRLETGERIRATAVGRLEVGGRSVVVIRPEHVDLPAATDERQNALAGVVEEMIFLGEIVLVRLRIHPALEVAIRIPARHLSGGLAIGQMRAAAWSAADCLAFTAGSEGHPD